MKPIDVKSSKCIYFKVKNNDKYPQFEVDDHVKISEYNNIFLWQYFSKSLHSKLVWRRFLIKKVKNTLPPTYVIEELVCEKIVGTFFEK